MKPEIKKNGDNTDHREAMLAAYEEVCKSFHAIDDFRMKLLGFLPLASLVGVLLIDKDKLLAGGSSEAISRELIGFAAIFASALTLALFSYELRGIKRCDNLIQEGTHIETELGIGHGQFHVCEAEHKNQKAITRLLNAKFAACAIYSLVFSGWLFIALRFGFGVNTLTCCVSAVIVGVVIAIVTYLAIKGLTPS